MHEKEHGGFKSVNRYKVSGERLHHLDHICVKECRFNSSSCLCQQMFALSWRVKSPAFEI